jgi:hypothetical protein
VDPLVSVLVSPSYDSDHTIYLRYQSLGMFASTDGGATFTAVDAQAGGELGDRLTAIDRFGAALPGIGTSPAVAIPGNGPGAFYRGQHVPVVGSGYQERGFYQVGHGDAAVVVDVSAGPDETFASRTRVSTCTAELACPGGQVLPAELWMTEFAADPAASATAAIMLMEEPGGRPAVWASTDKAATFVRNAAFDKQVADIERRGRSVAHGYAATVLNGGRTWLVYVATSAEWVPLVTTDTGKSWHRLSSPLQYTGFGHLLAAPDGRLYYGGLSFQCSVDGGRTWAWACAR